MTFHVGQKVVCLRDAWPMARLECLLIPQCGKVYVIRSIIPKYGLVGLRFHWLINPTIQYADHFGEASFAAWDCDGTLNFKPVVELKTDISIFTRMLTPSEIEKTRERSPA